MVINKSINTKKPAAFVGAESSNVSKKVRIIAKEVKIVQSLVCNDVTTRNRRLRKLRKWLQLRGGSSFPFHSEDYMRIWMGLYYSMWMSDKPLVQEELAEKFGQLLECFENNIGQSVDFFGAFLQTMCNHWLGIDQWRIDKYLMLVRRMLRYMLRMLKKVGWAEESIEVFNTHMLQTVLSNENIPTGLTMHFLDIFCEELAKVSNGSISAEQVSWFLKPFVTFIAMVRDGKLVSHCRSRIFYHLLYQSALGREYSEKYNAWKEMGFPTESINDIEKIDSSDALIENNTDDAQQQQHIDQKHLDPRAGDVDVFMSELPFDAKPIINELNLYIYKEQCSTKVRNMIKKLLKVFETYQRGDFPLGVKSMPRFALKSEKPLMKDKIEQLENIENIVYGTGRKLKQLNKRKRRKLLNSLSYENADESNFDQMIEKALPKQLNEREKRPKAAMMSVWLEEVIDEVEPKQSIPTINKHEKKPKQVKKTPENIEDREALKKAKKQDMLKNLITQKKNTAAPSDTKMNISKKLKKKNNASEWNKPLAKGEIEYVLPSRKRKIMASNDEIDRQFSSPSKFIKMPDAVISPNTAKRVKIALKHNTAQNPSEYRQQIKRSPQVPYDAHKKPGKGLLKPNLLPSPINAFYKKKIGLNI